jgi:SAM-dependent methyltransferase
MHMVLPVADLHSVPEWLVCPACRGPLDRQDAALACLACADRYPQRDPWPDLRPPENFVVTKGSDPFVPGLKSDTGAEQGWHERQQEMVAAYRDLIADPAHARLAYRYDLEPFRGLLADWRGRILDVGGGNGLVRHILPPQCEYISLDPDVEWLGGSWLSIADDFPCLNDPLTFVRGVGEQMPVADASMDGALSFWSLNHAVDPPRLVAELARVVRPAGRLLIVLDDVEPTWGDVIGGAYADERFTSRPALAWQKLRARLRGWPLQPDHLAVAGRDLARWTRLAFRQRRRLWTGRYLTLELTLR